MDDLYTWDHWWLWDIWDSNENMELTVRLGTLIFVQQMRDLSDCLAVEVDDDG